MGKERWLEDIQEEVIGTKKNSCIYIDMAISGSFKPDDSNDEVLKRIRQSLRKLKTEEKY